MNTDATKLVEGAAQIWSGIASKCLPAWAVSLAVVGTDLVLNDKPHIHPALQVAAVLLPAIAATTITVCGLVAVTTAVLFDTRGE